MNFVSRILRSLSHLNNPNLPELKLPELTFEEDLRGTIINTNDWDEFILINEEKLNDAQDRELIRHYCEHLGVAHRSLNQLDKAEVYLQKALSLSYESAKPYKIGQNLIRLAHVYQWKKQFSKSKILFDQASS